MNNSTDKKNFFRKISEYFKKYCNYIWNFLKKCHGQLHIIILLGILGVLYIQLSAIKEASVVELIHDLTEHRYQLVKEIDGEIWQYLYDDPEPDPQCTIDNIFPFDKRPSDPVSNPHETCLLKQQHLLNVFNYYYQLYHYYKKYGHRYEHGRELLREEMKAACGDIKRSPKLQEIINIYADPDKSNFRSYAYMRKYLIKRNCMSRPSDGK